MIFRRSFRNTLLAALLITLLPLPVAKGTGTAYAQSGTGIHNGSAIGHALSSLQNDLPANTGKLSKPASESTPAPMPQTQPKPQPLSQRVTDYDIAVKLDGNTLTGTETVTWKNPGKKTVSEMYLHLYPNAFLSEQTTFMKESGGKLREDKATESSRGYMRLESLKTEDGASLLPRVHFVQPDDGNPHDFTLAKFKLPEPVGPGEEITLNIGFSVGLPEVFARMGYSGKFIMAGQWFPKIAAYNTATSSRAEGWNVHQYHGNSEFYSDFGLYTVRIDAPAGYKVAATGVQTKPAEASKGGRQLFTYYAEDVHDFAWSASPDFIVSEEAFSSPGVPGVRIKLYLDPKHKGLAERYMHAAKSALAKYSQWYGTYPYSSLSIVVPPAGAGGAGGMEYPTLVTAFAADTDNPGYSLERAVVHEIGHQYWYGMVASNEFEEAWLDEGFTSYAEDKVMESEYGVEPRTALEASYVTDPAPLKQLSWSYGPHSRYADNVYSRAKLVLNGIENRTGPVVMNKILRTYFNQYKFKHPTTADFKRVVEQVTKDSWDDYFSQFVYGGQMADYAVDSIRVAKSRSESGKSDYESQVVIRRMDGVYGPVPVTFKFADGKTVERTWDGIETNVLYKLNSSSPLLWAAVDPLRTNALDNRQINNYLRAEAPPEQRVRIGIGIVKALEWLAGAFAW
ncbi:M1 family metallopeptidase [Paenibacillus pasadenensis]|uniref:M1 family metallopeptidase n=1 Tax=Paenibacillus pasadenensis TaxID=217090 RepID=UPI00203EC129|nr:M1 family metallopeptidase [Paenibacillus pasadenensis]MCM3749542.1 M1 family metallopeptidase [Paenibacillus pasadenensis]